MIINMRRSRKFFGKLPCEIESFFIKRLKPDLFSATFSWLFINCSLTFSPFFLTMFQNSCFSLTFRVLPDLYEPCGDRSPPNKLDLPVDKCGDKAEDQPGGLIESCTRLKFSIAHTLMPSTIMFYLSAVSGLSSEICNFHRLSKIQSDVTTD